MGNDTLFSERQRRRHYLNQIVDRIANSGGKNDAFHVDALIVTAVDQVELEGIRPYVQRYGSSAQCSTLEEKMRSLTSSAE